MKASLFPWFILAAVLTALSQQPLRADEPISPAAPSGGSASSPQNAATGSREPLGKLLAQLNLDDGQKQRISQIRETVTDRHERHREIWQVLTPDQRHQLKELRRDRKNGGTTGAEVSNPGNPPE